MRLDTVALDDILVENRAREEMGDIEGLAETIKEHGIISPLAVVEIGEGKFRLLAGGRRIAACKIAGVEKIPINIYPSGISENVQRSIELIENVQRKDLTWEETCKLTLELNNVMEAEHGRKMSTKEDAPGWTKKRTAETLGKSESKVSQDIQMARMLEHFPELRQAKNQHEATKLLKVIGRKLKDQQKMREIETTRSNTPAAVRLQKLERSYVVGDFFEGVVRIPDSSIDLVEIDPPYGIGLADLKRRSTNVKTVVSGYVEVEPDEYEEFLDRTIKESVRCMRDTGWMLLWFGSDPWWQLCVDTLRKYNLQIRATPAVWTKPNGQTQRPDLYLASASEQFFYARKPGAKIAKPGRTNVYDYRPVAPQRKEHPAERPIEMMEDIVRTFCEPGSRVMVPFAGSGNTMLAAHNLGCEVFGWDLNPDYATSYKIRVNEWPEPYASYPHAPLEREREEMEEEENGPA